MFRQREPEHIHDWSMISKEWVAGIGSVREAHGLDRAAFVVLCQTSQGYWSYVFRCDCGAVKVERS